MRRAQAKKIMILLTTAACNERKSVEKGESVPRFK
jgi:hypothetical protein